MSGRAERTFRVAYAGDDSFVTCLQALLDRPDVELGICLTAADRRYTSTVEALSLELGATVICGNPGSAGWSTLNDVGVDLLVSAAYGYRIPVDELNIETMVNVHPSHLPHGRGPNPLVRLARGLSQAAGVTIHLLDKDFDTGPILIQERFEDLSPQSSLNDLTLRAMARAPALLNRLLDDFETTLANATEQAEGSYWPGLDPSHTIVDLATAPGEQIARAIDGHGCQGFSFRLADGAVIEVKTAHFTRVPHCFEAGRLLGRLRGDYLLSAADGLIRGFPFCRHVQF